MTRNSATLPVRAGIGLRQRHLDEIAAEPGLAAWVEIHAENYMMPGGPRLAALERIRREIPVSVHGVGLSLGSASGIDREHLARLKALVDRIEPAAVSEHFAWSVADGVYLNDLLPLPCSKEVLDIVSSNVEQIQEVLGRRILVENPSRYLTLAISNMEEPELLSELACRTGCGLLLDVANIFVSSMNVGIDPDAYVAAISGCAVGEIHLAGHTIQAIAGGTLLVDSHSTSVPEPVWSLFERTLARIGPRPTLIEWDADVPGLQVLLDEAHHAETLIEAARRAHAA